MKFKFINNVDAELFNSTQGAWTSQVAEHSAETSATFYTAALEYCGRIVNGGVTTDGGGCVCAVVDAGDVFASALLVVSHAKGQGNLKMLNVYVQPSLNLADSTPDRVQLAWIAATAIVGCLDLTYGKYPSEQLKMHTTFPLDKSFMTAVATAVFADDRFSSMFDVESHGNWLVVTKKGGQSHVQPFRVAPSG